MKLFGSIKELVGAVFRKDSQQITMRPNQATTYTADRDIQLPPQDSDAVLVSANSTQTLTNKTISGSNNTLTILAGSQLTGQVPTANGGTGQNSTATFPTSGVVVTEAATETLTNKTLDNTNTVTLKDTLFTIQDDGDTSKQVKFQVSGVTAATTRTLTVPDVSDTLVTLSATQALTNKDYDGGAASNARRITLPKDTTTNINALTRKQGTVIYDTTTDQIKYDNGSILTALAAAATATPTAQGTVTSYHATIQAAVLTSSGSTISITTTDGYLEIVCSGTSGAQTVNLPASSANTGRVLLIKKSASGGSVVIDPNSTETLDGNTTYTLSSQYASVKIFCDGSNWFLVGETRAANTVKNLSGNYTILDGDGFETFTLPNLGADTTVTLPSAAVSKGRKFRFIKSGNDAGRLKVSGTIDGSTDTTNVNVINKLSGCGVVYCDGNDFFWEQKITEEGTYTPTLTAVSNITASTASTGKFTRVGNRVTVSTEMTLDPTATTTFTSIRVSVPIPSNFTADSDLSGTGNSDQLTQGGRCLADATNDAALYRFFANSSANTDHGIIFTYIVK